MVVLRMGALVLGAPLLSGCDVISDLFRPSPPAVSASEQVYRAAMAERTSPADLGNPRRDHILAFDQVSPTLALLKMQLEMFGGVMQDYLNIVFLDGQWWVMAKMWEKVGESAPA